MSSENLRVDGYVDLDTEPELGWMSFEPLESRKRVEGWIWGPISFLEIAIGAVSIAEPSSRPIGVILTGGGVLGVISNVKEMIREG